MDAGKYEALSNYLALITRQYQIQLCLNDFVGFISMDQDLDRLFRPFMAHTNPYCMYIKTDKCLFNKCLALKKPIAEKSMKLQRTFWGICHAGVGEYLVPIHCRGILIGVINVGVFQPEPKLAAHIIRKTCSKSTLQEETALRLYYQSILKEYPDLKTIAALLEIVADLLGDAHLKLQSATTGLKLRAGKKRYNSSEDVILAHILEYIRHNYDEPLTVTGLAAFCHCSESYINHLFKKRVGVNIKLYINKIRVEQAQTELVGSDLKVADIALKVGFNDANYFSRVFAAIMGISPLEYRHRFS